MEKRERFETKTKAQTGDQEVTGTNEKKTR